MISISSSARAEQIIHAAGAEAASILRRFAVSVDDAGQRRNLSRRDLSPLPPLPDLISPWTGGAARSGRGAAGHRSDATSRNYLPAGRRRRRGNVGPVYKPLYD